MNNEDSLITSDNIPLMKNHEIYKAMIKFSPLLLLYIVVVLMGHSNNLQGDEGRYVMYANNLLKGYYSPQGQIYLWNGPGYPIFLLPFIVFKIPWFVVKLFNPLLLFLAIIYFYSTLRLYMQEWHSLIFSYILGGYTPFSRYLHMMLTEHLSLFLICGFIFHFCKIHKENKTSWMHIISASFYLGFLALTKIFFGYVIFTGLLMCLIFYIQQRKDKYKKTFFVYFLALMLCVPYLSYTYFLTGKIFYWGNSGGLSLYLMSTPIENEYGDWAARNASHHISFYKELEGLSSIERDDALKKRAIENIKNHPVKFVKNWFANIGRLWFNYPFSYTPQKLSNFFYMIPNMFIIVIWILCIYPTLYGSRLIPFEIIVLMLMTLVSFGGMSLLDGENRYLWPIIPLFILWISFVIIRILKIELRQH